MFSIQLKGLLLYSLAVFFIIAGCSDKKPHGIQIGAQAPDFSLSDQTGKAHTLYQYKGRVVLLRFWADWCPNCKEEMPKINEAYKSLKGKGFEVLGVNVKQGEEAVSAFVREYGILFPTPLDKNADVAKKYGVVGLPTTFIIDKESNIREKVMGDMTKEDVERLAAPLL